MIKIVMQSGERIFFAGTDLQRIALRKQNEYHQINSIKIVPHGKGSNYYNDGTIDIKTNYIESIRIVEYVTSNQLNNIKD